MKFYNLKSIMVSQKVACDMRMPTDSFYIAPPRPTPYIEPTFSKIDFETERPQVVLISAVGATGKSALAHVLSNRTSLPLLDLGKHKPVGDNTLTGLLTSAFHVEDLSRIFQGTRSGTYGVIIDGIDEARSKTTDVTGYRGDPYRWVASARETVGRGLRRRSTRTCEASSRRC